MMKFVKDISEINTMTLFAIDTNLLVYAHDNDNPYHHRAKTFLIQQLQNNPQNLCIPYQVFMEFINTITRRVPNPISVQQAIELVEFYQSLNIKIIYPKTTQLTTFLDIFKQTPYKNRLFDIAIVSTLKDNGIQGIYTVNVKDFKDYPFLTVINPLHQP